MVEKIKKIKGIDKVVQVSGVFKMLSDPTRLKILCLLFDNPEGLCVNDIAEHVGISHSAASHQLTKLELQGIISSFREGQMICYFISKNESAKNMERVINIFRK